MSHSNRNLVPVASHLGFRPALRRVFALALRRWTGAGRKMAGPPSVNVLVNAAPVLRLPGPNSRLSSDGEPERLDEGGGLSAEVVDPMERARAALQEARRRMPHLLGLDESSRGDSSTVEHAVVIDNLVSRPAPARPNLLALMTEERGQLLEQITDMRGRLTDLCTQMSWMPEDPPDAHALLPPRTGFAVRPAEALRGAAQWYSVPSADVRNLPHPAQMAAETLRQPAPATTRDSDETQSEVRPSTAATRRAKLQARRAPPSAPPAPRVQPRSGNAIKLTVGPLRDGEHVHRLERRLAALPNARRVRLRGYNSRQAIYWVDFSGPAQLQTVLSAFQDPVDKIASCTWDGAGRSAHIQLAMRDADA